MENNTPAGNGTSEVQASLTALFLSLSAAALTYMGRQPAPGGQKVEPNLTLAKHTISTLEVLKTKTESNRTAEETKLLDELLYQLRLSYVRAEAETKEDKKAPTKETGRRELEPDPAASELREERDEPAQDKSEPGTEPKQKPDV